MALSATTQYANRKGLDFSIYAYPKTDGDAALLTIDYVNEVALDLSSGTTWATGGRNHANKIPFNDPIEGTFTVSTQILTPELMALMAGEDMSTWTLGDITFSNDELTPFYVIEGTTTWKDSDGKYYTETIKCHKAAPEKAMNITYTGEGDPNSVDIVFNLAEDDNRQVYTHSAAEVSGNS